MHIKHISATTGVTRMVHLSKFAEFYEKKSQIILELQNCKTTELQNYYKSVYIVIHHGFL